MGKRIDISSYLQSGVLELYVSGTLPEQEAAEVVSLAQQYPEINQEIINIEQAMIQYLEAYAPPVEQKQEDAFMASVFQQIEQSERESLPSTEASPQAEEKKETARVIPLEKPSSGWNWRTISIAASVLLLVSLGLNWLFFQRWQNTEGQLAGIIAERNQLAQEQETLQTSLSAKDQLLAHINDPSSKEIQISGAPLEKEGRAKVIWNPESHQVLLANYVLPEPPEGKQYQLWALYGSEPRDAGIFDQDSLQGFMKSIDGAPTAFAISLEKVGGSPSPTEVWAVGVVEG